MNTDEIISALAQKIASGELSAEYALPVIRKLSKNEKNIFSDSDLIEILQEEFDESTEKLLIEIGESLHENALKYYNIKQSGAPIPTELFEKIKDFPLEKISKWKNRADIFSELDKASKCFRDFSFTLQYAEKTSQIHKTLKDSLDKLAVKIVNIPEWGHILSSETLKNIFKHIQAEFPEFNTHLDALKAQFEEDEYRKRKRIVCALNKLPDPLPEDIDDKLALELLAEHYAMASDRKEKKFLLDAFCCWQTDSVIPLLTAIREPWAQKRASVILTMRFGKLELKNWTDWLIYLNEKTEKFNDFKAQADEFARKHPEQILTLWFLAQEKQDHFITDILLKYCSRKVEAISPEEFSGRYSIMLENDEKEIILAKQPENKKLENPYIKEKFSEETSALFSPQPAPEKEAAALPEKNKPEIPLPSLWQNHIQPFFAENWYMVAGIFMVIAGSSLLAFYTWDKHWLVPYTLMPALLGFFTASLAGVGTWIEKRGKEFLNMATMLRGAAIALLPVNFMAVALLSNDSRVSHKVIIVPLMGLIYILLGGWGLKKWCSAMHRSLGNLLGMTLLLLNALVIIGPIAKSFENIQCRGLNLILGTGFYLGFGVMVFSVIMFTKNILDKHMASEKRIPWFFGATLLLTFLQVFAWVHGFLGYLPHVSTYAPMTILTGGLVFLIEKRALQLKDESSMHEMESFFGFALIFAGILMGAAESGMRILSLELAGFIWLFQAFARKHPMHYWISLALFALGGSAVSLLKTTVIWLPSGPWLPILGIIVALSMSVFIYLANRNKNQMLKEAATGMQTVVLAVASVVTVLAQWHYSSKPILTAFYLLAITAVFLWRAFRDQKLRWLHTAMLILALALPYMGCVDITGKTLRGNSMVFGLSVLSFLWLGTIYILKHPLLIKARSTVVMFYGTTALAAMIIRVVIQRGMPGNVFMDYTGPLLIAAALIIVTYCSRSLIPAAIAAVILIILFPELKSHFREEFDSLGWGTGLGSACTAIGLTIVCFILRELRFLKNLGDGDLFLGKFPFFLRRSDHTLFTWPIIASALFLICKTDTITFANNLMDNSSPLCFSPVKMPFKTSIALTLTGICWTLLGIYHRCHRNIAVLGVHLGWIWIMVGVICGYYHLVQHPSWSDAVLIGISIIQFRYFIYRFWLQEKLPWVQDLLTKQMLYVLRYSSPILALACVTSIIFVKPDSLYLLGLFTAAQLIWHGIKKQNIFYGVCLYFLLWINLLAWTTPGTENLFVRISENLNSTPTLLFLLCIQLVHIAFEFKRDFHERLKPLLLPFMFIGTFSTVFIALSGFSDALYFTHLSGFQQALLLLLIFLTARAHASAPLAVMGLLLLYLYIHNFPYSASLHEKIKMIVLPLKLSVLGLALALFGQAGRMLHSRFKQLLAGPFSQLFYKQPAISWFFIPALAFALTATSYQTFNPAYMTDSVQALAPFVSAMTLMSVAYFWNIKFLWGAAIAILGLGNIYTIRIYLGDFLISGGLSHIHLVCLGLASTMLEASVVKALLKKEKVSVYVNCACLIIALIVLVMLSVNYFVNPNLLDITWLRFAVSGSMTLIAGLYFRRAARHPGPGEENSAYLCEAFYHYGISMTIWCAALMIPWFRTPATALFALGLPVLYFYLNAELKSAFDKNIAGRYRNSAATLSFIILALYLFRFAFRMALFPDNPIDLMHYHYSSPVIILLSLVMFRLHALGGTSWLAFYGGLALMTGTYFSFTSFPKLSPFYYPINAAWCAIIFSHFWTLLSYERSPVRTAIQRMSGINDASWHNLRKGWGYFLIVAAQSAMIWGLINYNINTSMVAPLLLGGASIFIHQGIIKKSPLYYGIAAFEFLLALHAGFFVASWLNKEHVIWGVLLIWGALLTTHEILRRKYDIKKLGWIYAAFAVLLMAHIFYHGTSSTAGLWAFAAGTVLAALSPCSTRCASHAGEILPAALLLLTPTWLIFFYQGKDKEFGVLFSAWSVLLMASSFFVTGICAKYYQIGLKKEYEKLKRPYPELFDRTLSWIGECGSKINIFTLCIVLFLISPIAITNYNEGFSPNNFALILALYLSAALAWYSEGSRLKEMMPYFIMLFCFFGAYAIARRQLMLAFPYFWRDEYDIWATLAISSIVSGLLQLRLFNSREIKIPLIFTLCAMPVLALIWTISHHLGTNTLLLVIGLYSVIFVFMGKDDRESPYHIAAVSGFVAFLLILFWNKLEVKVIHAYVIPVGIGILVLLQMFREKIKPPVRNHVRLVTLLAMLGSVGYYALIGNEINIIYTITFGIIGLFAMILGSLLKIRLYLLLGFTGLIVDVCVIFCKLVMKMQRNTQMTIIGSLVLLAGVGIVTGAILYKTHQSKITDFINNIRNKLYSWE